MRINLQIGVLVLICIFLSGCSSFWEGTWSGGGGSGLHVKSVRVSKNEFPCEGVIETQLGQGSVMVYDVSWEQRGDRLVGIWSKEQVAEVQRSGGTVSGTFSSPVQVGSHEKKLVFSGFKKQ